MAREKDYLDAVSVVALGIIFGPEIFMLIISLITGNPQPPNIDAKDRITIIFVCAAFSFSGVVMLAYVFVRRTMKWFSNKSISSRSAPKKDKNSTNDEI